jgi:nickel/cobalt exporter
MPPFSTNPFEHVSHNSTFAGHMAFSLIHILIPTNWVPLVAISKAEDWSRQKTLWTTAITGSTHTINTLLLGVVVGLLSYHLADNYETLTQLLTPLVLVGLGVFYLSQSQGQADATHDPD